MEFVDIYDDNMIRTNIVKERKEELLKGEYHLSVHLWTICDNKILIQKRSKNKKICPNVWSIVTGGVISGENAKQACKRECLEEIGIKIKDYKMVGSIKRKYDFVNIYITNKMPKIDDIVIDEKELQECKIIDINLFEQMIKNGEIIDSIIEEYYKYIKPIIGEQIK